MAVKTNTKRVGDLVKMEQDQRYGREGLSYTNGTGGDITLEDPLGYPCIDNGDGTLTLAVQATQANVNCLLLRGTKLTVADGATVTDLTVLRRGPALFNDAILPVNDHAAAAFTKATLLTALMDEFMKNVPAPPLTETQTT